VQGFHILSLHACLGGGYTQFHQDGHGTVDSGHSNLSGFNEVIMLRRLPECHKIHACQKIPLLSGDRTEEDAFKTLYKLPHDDGRVSLYSCWYRCRRVVFSVSNKSIYMCIIFRRSLFAGRPTQRLRNGSK
jgi:hypothetical protein